ncbi:MAG: hypothetical protein IKY74_03270 [Alistipes sp.]|nr:hypothetical protein [Alistipes sp.]
MDYNSKIRIIEGAIVQINANIGCNCDFEHQGNYLKQLAKEALKEIGVNNIILSSIQTIGFPSEDLPIGGLYNTRDIREENKRVAYRQSVKALVGILVQERERLVKEQQEVNETRDLKIQVWTLVFSAVAAVGAIISIFF